MSFVVGQFYTNDEIVAAVGGNTRSYLRHTKGGEIVAACLDAQDHPRAPYEIWVGQGTGRDLLGRSAARFFQQCQANRSKAVPLFIKDRQAARRGKQYWRYYGRWRVEREITHAPTLEAAQREGRPVQRIFSMRRVSL